MSPVLTVVQCAVTVAGLADHRGWLGGWVEWGGADGMKGVPYHIPQELGRVQIRDAGARNPFRNLVTSQG